MRKLNITFLTGIFLLLNTNSSLAAVNLPWSTTFNCADWTQTVGLTDTNCDGLTKYGDWVATDSNGTCKEQITSDANNSGGAGGKGQRHWLGDWTGQDNISGGTRIEFTTLQPELWVRWYMRFEKDFQWNQFPNFKVLYFDVGVTGVVTNFFGWEVLRFWIIPNSQIPGSTIGGWDTIMSNGADDGNGHKKSDGQWHYYEIHMKMDTNGSNGVGEMWVDGILKFSYSNLYYGTKGGWSWMLIGSNHAYTSNGRCMAVDYDDFEIRSTGPIGPIGGNTPPPPSGGDGDSSAAGGSGCGFVKEDGKGQGAKGEGVSMMILLFLLLIMFIKKKANHLLRAMVLKDTKGGFAKTTLFFITTAFIFLLFMGISHAADYYVSPTGAAAWTNCSGSTPLNGTSACSWQTAMANAVADDIVYFRGGTYSVESSCSGSWEWIAMTPANSGTSGHPITFIAYPGETPVITPCTASPISPAFGARDVDYIIYDGFSGTMASGSSEVWYFLYWNSTGSIIRNSNFTGANHPYASNSSPIRIEESSDNEVYNNVIHGHTGGVNTAGIWLFSATRVKIYNNTIYGCAHGIQQKAGPNIENEIYNNFLYSMTSDGIMLSEGTPPGGNSHKVYQNVLLNIGGVGIYIYDAPQLQTNYQIYNNTIYGADVGIHSSNTARNAQIWNNIIVGVGNGVNYARYYTGAALPTVSDYNNFYGTGNWNLNWTTNFTSISSWRTATGLDANSITSDPLFVNPGGANPVDYKLQVNSPARTSGRGGSYATVMGAYITGNETIGYDPDAPRVEITSPPNSTVTTTNTSITLQGTASDTLGIISVTCNNSRGGNCTCTGTTNWTCSNIPLQTGQNIITVTATDGDNKTGIDAITVTVSSGSGDTGGSGSESSASGGSGCGFVKDDSKRQRAKGEGLIFVIMLVLGLAGIAAVGRIAKAKRRFQS